MMANENRRNRMPKTKAEYISQLKIAFIAGCNFGYGVALDLDVSTQENLGAQWWVGEITDEELWGRIGDMHGTR